MEAYINAYKREFCEPFTTHVMEAGPLVGVYLRTGIRLTVNDVVPDLNGTVENIQRNAGKYDGKRRRLEIITELRRLADELERYES